MPTPCDIIDDLVKAGGHFAETGDRTFADWQKRMKAEISPDLSDAMLQRVWGKVRAELAKNPALSQAKTADVFIEQLARRVGREGAANFADAMDDMHPDIFRKLVSGTLLSAEERKIVAEQYGLVAKRGAAGKAVAAVTGGIGDVIQAARETAKERARLNSAAQKAARTPEQNLRDAIAPTLGKRENADRFLADLKSNNPDLYNALLTDKPMTASQKRDLAQFYDAHTTTRNQTSAQVRQAVEDIRSASKISEKTVQTSVDKMLANMSDLFPETAKKEDLAPIALKEYRDSAGDLTRFARAIKKQFGDQLSEQTMKRLFTEAANQFRQKTMPVDDIKQEMTNAAMKEILANRTPAQKAWDRIRDASNAPTSLITSVDFSAPFRQGASLTLANPKTAFYGKESPFYKMFQAFKSKEVADEVMAEIKTRSNAMAYKDSGLYLSEHGDGKIDLSKAEEVFRSNLAEKVPWVRSSERAYVTYLNKLRADSFDLMYRQAANIEGGTPSEATAKAIANYINVATGRGSNGKFTEGAAKAFSGIIFSPRNAISQFQYAGGQPLYSGTKASRMVIGRQYAQYAVAMTTVYALAKAAGFKVNFDPESSDFMKIQIGSVMIDPFGGRQQPVRVIAQLLSGQKTKQGGAGSRSYSPKDVATDYVRNKLSPVAGAVVDVLSRNQPEKPFPNAKATDANGNLLAPYGRDFLGRNVADVGGVGTDIYNIATGNTKKPVIEKGKQMTSREQALGAIDYYATKLMAPITVTDILSGLTLNGVEPQDIPPTILATSLSIFGMGARVMDVEEVNRRANPNADKSGGKSPMDKFLPSPINMDKYLPK